MKKRDKTVAEVLESLKSIPSGEEMARRALEAMQQRIQADLREAFAIMRQAGILTTKDDKGQS